MIIDRTVDPASADLVGVLPEPVESEPARERTAKQEPSKAEAREGQHFVIVCVCEREYQAEKELKQLRKLGHDSAHRDGRRVLVGPCKHEHAAKQLRDQLATNGYPHARVIEL